jgi:hypothetical protein
VPLSDDQRALLRLLAQREEGYEDIAALMGVGVDEVRRRVKDAVAGLDEGERVAGPVVGRASSSSRDDAAGEEARSAPPAAETPSPARAAQETQPVPRPSKPAPASSRSRLPKDQRRLWELVGGALVVLLIVLFATGAIDIGGDDSDSDGSDSAALQGGALNTANGKLTQATLEPVAGGDAEGQALFGRLGKQVLLQVLAEGLEPTGDGESYAIWLYRSPKLALRVGAVKVREEDEGKLAARFPVPTELLALVASGSFRQIQVSLTPDAAYKAEVAAARQQQRLPRYTGETVLQGEIVGPIVKAGAGKGS